MSTLNQSSPYNLSPYNMSKLKNGKTALCTIFLPYNISVYPIWRCDPQENIKWMMAAAKQKSESDLKLKLAATWAERGS